MPRLRFGGHDFQVAGRTALFWPSRAALIVADLHLEKASWFAARGQMLPPHDSIATLDRLAGLITTHHAREIWCLGDNFHDDDGANRLMGAARERLAMLTGAHVWHWITGNHDAHLPATIGGTIMDEAAVDGIVLRHKADRLERRPEMSGHFHPKFSAQAARGKVTRPCFVATASKLVLPAFGALTGGLAAQHPEIIAATGAPAEALIASGQRLLRFALPG
jgi:uncharacterized protein